MTNNLPTMRWARQQHFAGLTNQGFVASLDFVRTDKTKADAAPHGAFAKRLEDGMVRSGIKAADIVEELGVDDETVRLWRRGKRMPREKEMRRLAKMIGVDPGDLRYGEKDKPPTMPQLRGEHVTDEDELALLRAYRGLTKEWARTALRKRAVELLEEFGEPSAANPLGRGGGTQ